MKFLTRLVVLAVLTGSPSLSASDDLPPLPLLQCEDIGTNVGGLFWAQFCLSNSTCNRGNLCRKAPGKDTVADEDTVADRDNECDCQ